MLLNRCGVTPYVYSGFVLNQLVPVPKNEVPDHIPTLVENELDFKAYGSLMGGAACRK